jgi:hypothetical protein
LASRTAHHCASTSVEHNLAPGFGEGVKTLDLVRAGAHGSPRWTRVWPAAEDNPRHARLEVWMVNYGHQIVSRPTSWCDSCEGENGGSPASG